MVADHGTVFGLFRNRLDGIKRFSEDMDFDVSPGKKYKLEDHDALLELLCNEFQKEGYEVECSSNVTKNNVITGKLVFPGLEHQSNKFF